MDADKAVMIFSALANEIALDIVSLLGGRDRKSLTATQISHAIGASPDRMARRLQQMQAVGLLVSHRSGETEAYTLNHRVLDEIKAFMTGDS